MPDRAADTARLLEQAAALGVALAARQAEALLGFRDLLVKWNRAFNLVSRRDVARLMPRHVLDSLSVAPYLVGREVLDVGTGAGFPGIPLAIAREDAQFTLVDTSERRIRFIQQTVRTLNLGNVSAHCSDVAALDPAWQFDTVVSRAVAAPAALWALAGARVRPRGRMVAMFSTGNLSAGAGADPAAAVVPLPEDALLEQCREAHIPGLPGRHTLLLLRHRSFDGARSGSAA